MYRIDRATNSIERIARVSFSELSFGERKHLQEWIAASPDCLGEDLLIIQKEFDGFDETRERLDLLALDKQGRLVIIENKLDDTGRDVVWQALKYAAYCSTLKGAQIVDIFSRFLRAGRAEAETAILDFLEEESLDEVILNKGNEQRVILIAANFRKEVTATALWLLNHRIDVKCFQVTPYRLGSEVFLNFEQIIPPPEAADYMIGISEKEAEVTEAEKTERLRYKLRREFWAQCLEALKQSKVRLYDNISPSADHWLSAGSGARSCPYVLIFNRTEARVHLEFNRPDQHENKRMFDYFHERKAEIESAFGTELVWRRMDDKKSSKIEHHADFDGFDKESWPNMIAWLVEYMERLETVLSPHIRGAAAAAQVQQG